MSEDPKKQNLALLFSTIALVITVSGAIVGVVAFAFAARGDVQELSDNYEDLADKISILESGMQDLEGKIPSSFGEVIMRMRDLKIPHNDSIVHSFNVNFDDVRADEYKFLGAWVTTRQDGELTASSDRDRKVAGRLRYDGILHEKVNGHWRVTVKNLQQIKFARHGPESAAIFALYVLWQKKI